MSYLLRELGIGDIEIVKKHFVTVFSDAPWYDEWNDEEQLHKYIIDLIGQGNSLTLGFFEGEEIVGLSMGHIRHWFSGTEYFIDELCILQSKQGLGIGSAFLKSIEEYILSHNMTRIALQTERNIPAYHFYIKNGYTELSENVAFLKEFNR